MKKETDVVREERQQREWDTETGNQGEGNGQRKSHRKK